MASLSRARWCLAAHVVDSYDVFFYEGNVVRHNEGRLEPAHEICRRTSSQEFSCDPEGDR